MSNPYNHHQLRCTPDAQDPFCASVKGQMLRVNGLMMVNAILTAVLVGIGAYGRRYRHHPLTRFLFLTANALFLPIVSYIVTTIDNQRSITVFADDLEIIAGRCWVGSHFILVMAWTGLVQIVGINIIPIVATDAREGRNVGPPVVLLVQALWTSCLAFITLQSMGFIRSNAYRWFLENTFGASGGILLPPFVIIFAKLLFKLYAWYKAGQSVALGRVPRLIVGYMEQLQSGSKSPTELLMTIDEHMHIPPPPLIVMGEDTVLVEKQHHGYSFKWPTTSNRVDMPTRRRNNALVTIDRIWQLNDAGFLIQRSTPTTPQQLKDVCLSFSLFKLLRCRYARYTISEAGFIEARNFLWHMLLEDCDGERVLMVMVHELSFLHDYYYSSFPMSYSKTWLPVMSVFISLLSMSYCLLLAAVMCLGIFLFSYSSQLTCKVQCWNSDDVFLAQTEIVQIGNALYDYVQLVLLVALVMLTEVREIASYICSNWTKVALICRYMNDTSWQQSSNIQRRIGRVLQCRCTLLKHWEGKMSQCSILVLRPGRTPLALLRRLIHLPEENKLVPRAVKAAVLHALRSYDEGSRSGGVAPLPSSLRGRGGGNLIWEFSGTKGTAHTMLVCHIATSILEVRMGTQHLPDDHHIAATHLSRYCAYLVAHSPELLPDDDGWCKSLYKAVKKDADRVRVSSIPVSTPQVEYQQLVELLGTRSKHEILKNGLELGKRLADLAAAEEAAEAWRVLAGFWSEMILYVAPSENLDGHAEAIARGGEFITLLWALLAHLGIVRRADHTTTTAAAAGGGPAVV